MSPGVTSIYTHAATPRKKSGLRPSRQTQKHLYNICTMLDQRRRRWAGVAQMLYKCFVFAGVLISYLSLFYFHNYQTDRYIICVIDIK